MTTNMILNFGVVFELLLLAIAIVAILQKKKKEFFLWGKWTLIASLGFTIGLITEMSGLNYTLVDLIIGLALGFAEWLVLRSYLNNSTHWILATIIGFACTISVQPGIPGWIYFSGVFLGATQFLVLGNQYSKSGWWIFANVLAIAWWVFQVETAFSLFNSLDWKFLSFAGLSTIVYSAITGITLVWLLQRHAQRTNFHDGFTKPLPSEDSVA